MQMYIIAQKGGYSPDTSPQLIRFVRECGGFVLMATRTGPLIALDDSQLPAVSKHPLVGFIGPVTLNPRGVAAEQLQRIFAENLSKQIDLERLADLQSGATSQVEGTTT